MDEQAGRAWVQRVLGVEIGAEPAVAGKGGVEFAKLRLSWDDARKHLGRQLKTLKAEIIKQSAEEDDFAEIQNNAGEVEQALANLDDALSDALDDLYNAGGGDARLRQTAKSLALSYRSYIDTDPLLQELDGNPFVPLDARKRLDGALGSIMARL